MGTAEFMEQIERHAFLPKVRVHESFSLPEGAEEFPIDTGFCEPPCSVSWCEHAHGRRWIACGKAHSEAASLWKPVQSVDTSDP